MKTDNLSRVEVYLQSQRAELNAKANMHQGMRYRYRMLQALEHDAALDALYFVQQVLGWNDSLGWEDQILGRLGMIERLYAGNWPAIARKSTSPPAPLHCDGEGWPRSGRGEVDPIAQALLHQISAPSLDPIARLRLEAGVAALNYLECVLTETSQRTIIAALLGLERTVLRWRDGRAKS